MDALMRFSGGGHCPKCTVAPCNAAYCEKDCTRGPASEKAQQSPGRHFTSDTPAMGADLPGHLHRVCRGCGYEWLERTADAPPGQGEEKRCGFCLLSETAVKDLSGGLMLIEGVAAKICPACVERLRVAVKEQRSSLGLAATSPTVQ